MAGRRTFLGAVITLGVLSAACEHGSSGGAPELRIGSKNFTESVILGEIALHLVRSTGAGAVHRRALGGTRVVWNALRSGEIDVYPEYTGTITEEILKGRDVAGGDHLAAALDAYGIRMSRPLGFHNNYALGMREERAARLEIERISDLIPHAGLAFRLSNEFMDRADGWPRLRAAYGLPQRDVRGLDHDLAYRALESGSADVIDLYTTDAEIPYYGFRTLEDDRGHFTAYEAVLLHRTDLAERAPAAVAALGRLAGRIDERRMMRMNGRVKLEGEAESSVAADFVSRHLELSVDASPESFAERLLRRTVEHLTLVGISLATAILVAIPLGVLAAKRRAAGRVILGLTGVVQTIPALALLVFMIPLLGLGGPPAVVALFLYSLLPIVRNTCSGLVEIPAALSESAEALGLPPAARLRLIELPLASPAILAGVKTSAVINVGAATLGALIGAGGFGQPILTGIRLDDVGLILEGAVPAALLALIVQGLFDLGERVVVPKGLRLGR
jgi:osmoprotectant transport system permease protein